MVTLVTTNTFSTPQAAITILPRIVGPQRMGSMLAIAPASMTGLTSYQWRVDGVNVDGATGASYSAPMMGQVSCFVTGDQGTAETPAIKIYHSHDEASHNNMDDAILALVPHVGATHIAIADGDWSSAAIWDAGAVPGDGAVVLVPYGSAVTYDVAATAPRLDRLRVDGLLNWAVDQNTQILVETILGTQSGEIRIATSQARLPDTYTAEIIFSDRSYGIDPDNPTDLDWANDPTLISRGLLWHGKVSIWAADATPWLKTEDGSAPMAGDTSLTLEVSPDNWHAGDTIVIGSTHMIVTNHIPNDENEERVITQINGATVSWDAGQPLIYDHDHQNPAISRTDLQPAVLNKWRNVVMRTEAPHEDAVWRRAHTMAVHGTAIADIWGVAFLDLGRTDKSVPSGVIRDGQIAVYDRDVSIQYISYQTLSAQSNVQSRYPAHLHFVGFGRGADKSIIQNCYVENTPAWAYIHHGCEADFFDNVGYRFAGAGMVSETGDELGAWVGNLMVGTRRGFNGDRASAGNPKVVEGTESRYGDFGFTGMGMFFRGRAMRVSNNFVMGTPSAYVFFHRANKSKNPGFQLSAKRNVPRAYLDVKSLSYLQYGDGFISPVDLPIRHFASNECAGIQGYGFAVTKSGAKQNHALAINVKNNKFWAAGIGAHLEYIARYNFLDNEFFATARGTPGKTKVGFRLAAIQISNVRNHIEGFEVGFDLWGVSKFAWTKDFNLPEDPLFAIVEPTFVNVTTPYKVTASKAENLGLTTITAMDRTLILASTPTEVIPTLSGPFIAYDWDGTRSNDAVTKAYEWYNSVYMVNDSLGATPIPVSYDASGLWSGQSDHDIKNDMEVDKQSSVATGHLLQKLALREGYWTYQGDNILVFPLYVSDRITGRPALYTIAVKCTGSMANYSSNGVYTLSATNPTRADIFETTTFSTPITIDILSGATGETGANLSLTDEVIKPDYGELTQTGSAFNNGDGTITYTPDRDYVSPDDVPDVLYVHITDGRGRYHTVRVTISTII